MKLKFKIKKFLSLHAACLAISDLQEPVVTLVNSAGKRHQEQRAFPVRLSAEAIHNLRKNLRALDAVVEPALQTKADLVKQHSLNGKIDLDAEFITDPESKEQVPNSAREKYLAEIGPILEKDEELELFEIRESSLNIGDKPGQNNIPLRILRTLDPIIKEEAPKEEKTAERK